MTGKHGECGKDCYTMNDTEYQIRKTELSLTGLTRSGETYLRGQILKAGVHGGTHEERMREIYETHVESMVVQSGSLLGGEIENTETLIINLGRAGEEATRNIGGTVGEETLEDSLDFMQDYGMGYIGTLPIVPVEDLPKTFGKFGTHVGENIGGYIGGGGLGTGLGMTVDALRGTYRNHKIKRAVLSKLRKDNRIGNLLTKEQESSTDAEAELQKIVKGKSVIGRSDRVSNKIAWYFHKIAKIEKELKDYYVIFKKTDFTESRFKTCKDAKNSIYALNYSLRQYDKLITFLVYFLIILEQIDEEVYKKVETPKWAIIDPDEEGAVKRPTYMKVTREEEEYLEEDEED